jgi:hypothetical protein
MTSDSETDDTYRRCLRVLRMVHELHKRGYQRIRIAPGMAPHGLSWRCTVTHVGNILKTHGGKTLDFNRDTIHYSSRQEAEYFGWKDARNDTVVRLADRFLERCPAIADAGRGRDWEYVGWYVEMLGLAERHAFPIAYDDSHGPIDPDWFPTTGLEPWARLPMPPGGEAEGEDR